MSFFLGAGSVSNRARAHPTNQPGSRLTHPDKMHYRGTCVSHMRGNDAAEMRVCLLNSLVARARSCRVSESSPVPDASNSNSNSSNSSSSHSLLLGSNPCASTPVHRLGCGLGLMLTQQWLLFKLFRTFTEAHALQRRV